MSEVTYLCISKCPAFRPKQCSNPLLVTIILNYIIKLYTRQTKTSIPYQNKIVLENPKYYGIILKTL